MDGLWKVLELCWAPQPKDRPSIEEILQCLEEVLDLSEPLSPWVDDEAETDSDDNNWASDSSGAFSHFIPSARFNNFCVLSRYRYADRCSLMRVCTHHPRMANKVHQLTVLSLARPM